MMDNFTLKYGEVNKIDMKIDGERILRYVGKNLPDKEKFNPKYFMPFETKMSIGTRLIETIAMRYDRMFPISYYQLKKLGFLITYDLKKKAVLPRKRARYKLHSISPYVSDAGQIPVGHTLWHDPVNKGLLLKGGGYEDAVLYGTDQPKPTIELNEMSASDVIRRVMKSVLKSDIVHDIKIDEVPVMITSNNQLLCTIHKGNTPFSYGAFGSRGGGKTMLLHAISDSLRWKYDDIIMCSLNDQLNQFFKWVKAQDNLQFIKTLELINHYARPQPMVFLYPSFTSYDEMSKTDPSISLRISIPEEKILKNWDNFFEWVKDLQLGKSSKWFEKIVDRLIEVPWEKRDEAIHDMFFSPDKSNRIPETSEAKIRTLIEWLYKQNITDKSSGVPSKWEVDGEMMDPISACMKVGLFPCLENQEIAQTDKRKIYYPNYMSYWIEEIYNNCNNRKFEGKRCYMLLDEIGDFYKTGARKTKLYESLVKLFTKGRKPNISPMYSIQAKGKVDEEILLNTNYSFFFSTPENGIFPNMPREVEAEVQKLRPFECIAIARNTHFVVYEPNGQRQEIDPGEPVKGISLIFPASAHALPGE